MVGHWFTRHFRDFKKNDALFQKLRDFMIRGASSASLSRELCRFLTLACDVAQEEYDLLSENEKKNSRFPTLASTVAKKSQQGTFVSMYDSSVLVENPPAPILPPDMKAFGFMDINEVEIARQLTIAEFHIYTEIQVRTVARVSFFSPSLTTIAVSSWPAAHRAPGLGME